MATYEQRGNRFRVIFRFRGERLTRAVKDIKTAKQADALCDRLEETIGLVERGALKLPAHGDKIAFLLSGGKIVERSKIKTDESLRRLLITYRWSVRRVLEFSTRYTIKIHTRHLRRLFPDRTQLSDIDTGRLQQYVNNRQTEGVLGTTVRKEIVTLRSAWNHATTISGLTLPFPKGLKYPKEEEKEDFQTWRQIEERIKLGASPNLWECLFLDTKQIKQLLQFVEKESEVPYVYPMFVLIAHTGIRRSELIRSMRSDVDFEHRTITIRERKKSRTKLTRRKVPLTSLLASVLRRWFDDHPKCNHTICDGGDHEGVTRDGAHRNFKAVLKGTKWKVIRGFHIFRHSFCSNLAAKNTDQRLINAWVGHMNPETEKRYRHLFPSIERKALDRVYGGQ